MFATGSHPARCRRAAGVICSLVRGCQRASILQSEAECCYINNFHFGKSQIAQYTKMTIFADKKPGLGCYCAVYELVVIRVC